MGEGEREAAAGRFRCWLVRSAGFVRACGVWWRAFVVESVLRSLLCGVVGVPSWIHSQLTLLHVHIFYMHDDTWWLAFCGLTD